MTGKSAPEFKKERERINTEIQLEDAMAEVIEQFDDNPSITIHAMIGFSDEFQRGALFCAFGGKKTRLFLKN